MMTTMQEILDELRELGFGTDEAIPGSDAVDYLCNLYERLASESGDEDAHAECNHEWNYTGTAYGGDDERFHGEGRTICNKCGADGDA